jgi:hypothetical protein
MFHWILSLIVDMHSPGGIVFMRIGHVATQLPVDIRPLRDSRDHFGLVTIPCAA